ncbi:MAG: GTP-binding protein [Myxococcota bacterium]
MVTVHIVIGLLGSGKTSMLLHVLHSSTSFEKIGVVVGEFADEGYDGSSLSETGFPVMMISGIGRREQITAYLGALRHMVESGRFQRIFLETSGATEATLLAEALHEDTLLANQITLGKTVTVVSSADYDHYMQHFADQLKAQLRYADVVVLNKIDKLKQPDERERVKASVRALNSDAEIALTYMGQVDRLTVVGPLPEGQPSRLIRWRGLQRGTPREFESFVYRTERLCVDRVLFGHALLNLPGRIARFKGVLATTTHAYALNGVPGQLDWESQPAEGSTRVAIIGLDIKPLEEEIGTLLDASLNPYL